LVISADNKSDDKRESKREIKDAIAIINLLK
jgi:hypothetical protein